MTGLKMMAIGYLVLMCIIPLGCAWEMGGGDEISKKVVDFIYKKIGRH